MMRPLGEGKWKLLKLKVLVINCYNTDFPGIRLLYIKIVIEFLLKHRIYIAITDGIDYLIKACPRIEEFHLNNLCWRNRNRTETITFLSSIRFNRLTWLRIKELDLYDGAYLPLVDIYILSLSNLYDYSNNIFFKTF